MFRQLVKGVCVLFLWQTSFQLLRNLTGFLLTGKPPISLVARIGNDFDLALSGFVTCVWEYMDTNIELSLRVEHRDSDSSHTPESAWKSISAPCSNEDGGRAVEFTGLSPPAYREPGYVFRIYTNGRLGGPGGKRSLFTSPPLELAKSL